MFRFIARYFRGTQRAEAFCQEHGITRSSLDCWRRKHAAFSSEVMGDAFVEVPSPVWRDGGALIELSFRAALICVYFRRCRRRFCRRCSW